MSCQVGRAYNICPLASWFPPWILYARTRLRPYLLESVSVMLFDTWHLLVLQFGCSTLEHLRYTCCHNGVFSFPHNRRFSCKVLCLEGGCFKFRESQPLIQWGWIIRLLSLKPFEFRPSNEKLRGYPRTQFSCHVHWSGWLKVGIYTPSFLLFIPTQFQTSVSLSLWLTLNFPEKLIPHLFPWEISSLKILP